MQYSRDLRIGTYYRYKLFSNLGLFRQIREKHKILDIGGFDGFILSTINNIVGTVVDLDINAKYRNINYIKSDFFENKLRSQIFDYIFAFDVLEHIPFGKEREFIKKAILLLTKNGVLYLSTPSDEIRLFPAIITTWVSKNWGHTKCLGYSKKELVNFIDVPGLKIEVVELPARNYLNLYIFLKLFQAILPAQIIDMLLTLVSSRDANNTLGKTGFYLLKIRK